MLDVGHPSGLPEPDLQPGPGPWRHCLRNNPLPHEVLGTMTQPRDWAHEAYLCAEARVRKNKGCGGELQEVDRGPRSLSGVLQTFPHMVSSCKASPLWPKLLSEGARPHTSVHCDFSGVLETANAHLPTLYELPNVSQPLLLWDPITWLMLANDPWALGRSSRTSTTRQWPETKAGRLDPWVSRWQELPPAFNGSYEQDTNFCLL